MKIGKNSKYSSTPVVVDPNGLGRYARWYAPLFGEVQTSNYTVKINEEQRPDILSFNVYGETDLWWLILHFNGINDPLSIKAGDQLKIPKLNESRSIIRRQGSLLASTAVGAVGSRSFRPSAELDDSQVEDVRPYTPPPFVRAGSTFDDTTSSALQPLAEPLFNFGFPLPEGFSGLAHFQIQISSEESFTPLVYSLMTQSSIEQWFFYDHLFNSGSGGFRGFPSGGIDAQIYQGQSVYRTFNIGSLVRGETYYFRFRVWVDNIESQWFAPPPVTLD